MPINAYIETAPGIDVSSAMLAPFEPEVQGIDSR
jgi:hypothetical protein